jgi:hypothetical protein
MLNTRSQCDAEGIIGNKIPHTCTIYTSPSTLLYHPHCQPLALGLALVHLGVDFVPSIVPSAEAGKQRCERRHIVVTCDM